MLIPKLDSAILAPACDPLSILREANRKDVVFVPRTIKYVLSKPLSGFSCPRNCGIQFPVLDLLIQCAGDESLAIWSKCD